MVTLSCLSITFGQVVAYLTGFLMSMRPHGWRWMVGLGAVPALVQFASLIFLPESPRWLVKQERYREAKAILRRVYDGGSSASDAARDVADRVLQEIKREVDAEEMAARARARRKRRSSADDDDDEDNDDTSPCSWLWSATLADTDIWGDLFSKGSHIRALAIACLLQGLQQLCGFVGCSPLHSFLPKLSLFHITPLPFIYRIGETRY